jgi:hypothetical protein
LVEPEAVAAHSVEAAAVEATSAVAEEVRTPILVVPMLEAEAADLLTPMTPWFQTLFTLKVSGQVPVK